MPTLNWIGKDKVTHHHLDVPFRTLVPRAPYGDSAVASENLVIHGDNLEALKALLPQYEGQVKVVCIDPPYNTGNEGWVYNDNVNDPKIKKWLGEVVGKEGEDLSRHDKWLCMMYPRLKLLHRLLRDDGSIWVCIDDNEVASLRLLMDEIFGGANFIGSVIWQKRTSPDARLSLSTAHDYIIVYSKTRDSYEFNRLSLSEDQQSQYRNPDNDANGPWVSTDFTAQGYRPNQMYTITTPAGVEYQPPQGRCWSNLEPVFLSLVAEGRIWFGKDKDARPRVKNYLSEVDGVSAWTWWPNDDAGHNQEAKKETNSILGPETPFDTPKPSRLIERILQIATTKGSDLVLDSFAGSGTTAHAVLKLNKADGGHRRFILIEREDYAETITAERVRRVIDGYGPEDKKVDGLGGGFTYATLGPTIFTADGALNPEVELSALRQYIWYAETKTPMPNTTGEHPDFLGSCRGVSYYFAYRPNGETILDFAYLKSISRPDEQFVIYADSCAIEASFLKANGIQFKKIPRDVPRY